MEDKKQKTTEVIIAQMKELVDIKDSFNAQQLTFVKNLINPDLSDNELYMFLMYANKAGLNPFNKEIIAIVYGKETKDRKVNIIVTRDGKRATAYRQGGIESIETEPIYVKVAENGRIDKVQPWEGGNLWGATCTVVRDGKKYTATVPFAEYNTGRSIWATKPETMIKKVAESQALSMAVPELLGVYDESEMGQENVLTSLPADVTDEDLANESQKDTVKILLEKQDKKPEEIENILSGLTKGQAKKIMLEAAKPGKKS